MIKKERMTKGSTLQIQKCHSYQRHKRWIKQLIKYTKRIHLLV